MDGRIANPKALGFGALAITGWTYSMAHAGWLMPATLGSGAAHDVAVFATFALLVAALAAFLRGETWHAVFFMFLSAFWWAVQATGGEGQAQALQGWYYLASAVFLAVLGAGGLQSAEVGTDASLVALGVAFVLIGLGLADLGLPTMFTLIGGYAGLATALLSFWVAARELMTAEAGASRSREPAEGVR